MKSVRRSLQVLLALGVTLIALVGAVGALSALNSARAVDEMVDTIRPAAVAARAMRTNSLVAGASIRAFALSSDESELPKYRKAVAQFRIQGQGLAPYLADHPRREALRDLAMDSFDAWVDGYAEPRVHSRGGPGSFNADLYRNGQTLFQHSQETLTSLADAIERDYSAVRTQIRDQMRATVALIVVAAVLGAVMLGVLGWWIAGSIERPLGALAAAVRRLRDGEYDVRADVTGPSEVREVASAVNELATENDRARAMEEQIQRELRAMDQTRSEFVSNVSHELRTPLTIISGNLELIEDDLEDYDSAPVQHMLGVTRRNVTRLSELIEDLLTLNTAEHSGTALDLVDLQALVREVLADMRVSAGNRGVTLEHQYAREPIIVLGDANQLRRVVLNLLSNAVKFSPDDAEVRLDLERGPGSVILRVVDHGMGIPAEDLDKIGARFFRASNAVRSEISGTGLGLRIVQTIVHNHHGTMQLESEFGSGTTVTLNLPLADPGRDPEAEPELDPETDSVPEPDAAPGEQNPTLPS